MQRKKAANLRWWASWTCCSSVMRCLACLEHFFKKTLRERTERLYAWMCSYERVCVGIFPFICLLERSSVPARLPVLLSEVCGLGFSHQVCRFWGQLIVDQDKDKCALFHVTNTGRGRQCVWDGGVKYNERNRALRNNKRVKKLLPLQAKATAQISMTSWNHPHHPELKMRLWSTLRN